MDEMNLQQALGVAKQLKNHWRAFEHLDSFIKRTVALEGTLKEFETRRDGLQKEVDALEQRKRKLPEIQKDYERLEGEVTLLEKKKASMATIESDCARLETERATLEKAVNGLKAELQELRTRMATSLKKMA